MHISDKQYITIHLGRLKEHEGSIFRIAWSSDGSKFMSVSDDRRLVHFPSLPSAFFTLDFLCLLIGLLEHFFVSTLLSSVLLVSST
jgi:hypothetical protein